MEKRYTIVLIWEDEPGLGTVKSSKEFPVTCSPDDVEERGELLMGRYGAWDYEIVEL